MASVASPALPMRPGRVLRLGVGVALCLSACGDPTFTLYVDNQTGSEYIVLAPEAGRASVRVPAHGSGTAAGSSLALVGFRGEALVLTPNCVLLQSLAIPSDASIIRITADSIFMDPAGSETLGSREQLPSAEECDALLAPSDAASSP